VSGCGVLFFGPRLAHQFLRLLHGCDPAPIVRRLLAIAVSISQAEKIRNARGAIAGAPWSCDLYEAKAHHFMESRHDRVPTHAIMIEIAKGDGQPAIVLACMLGKLGFDAVEYPER